MKILEEGNPWRKQVRCTGLYNSYRGCSALLEISKNDIMHTENLFTIKCPCCHEWTDINASDIPLRYQREILKLPLISVSNVKRFTLASNQE